MNPTTKSPFGSHLLKAFAAAAVLTASPAFAGPYLYPGPAGENGKWGVRTYLNEGINGAEDLGSVLAFLTDPSTASRTPALSPANTIDAQVQTLNFLDPQTNIPGGVVAGATPFPGNTAADDNHVVTVAHGILQITVEDDYTFNNHSDDGFLLRVLSMSGPEPVFSAVSGLGTMDGNMIQFGAGTGDADTRGVIHLPVGYYRLEYVTWEGAGGFFYQLTAARGAFLNNGDTTTWRPIGYTAPLTGVPIAQPTVTADWTVQSTLPGGSTVGNLAGAEAAITAAVAADPVGATSTASSINFNDPETNAGSPGRIPFDIPWPRNGGGDDENYAMRMTATLHIPAEGDYQFGYAGDDGSRLSIANAFLWKAYNDSAFKAGQVNSPNATVYGIGRNYEGSGPSGLLKNITTGADTAVTATYTEFFTTGSINSAGDAAGYTAGTDAAAVFQGFVDIAGNMSYGDAPGWYADLTLTGLDPNKNYTFAATANRNGGPTYASRVTNWSLMGADGSTYASSAGAKKVSGTSVEFSTGENGAGLIARWTDIKSGADGTIVIRTTHGVGETAGGIAGADPFRGYAGGVFMFAEQSEFTALTENLTGAAGIGLPDTVAVNSGSLGAAANFSPLTSAAFRKPGALAGSTDTGIETMAADALKMQVPFNAAFNTSSFTVEAWVKPAVVNAPTILTCVMANGHFADPRSGWLVYQSDVGWVLRTYNQNALNFVVNMTGGTAPVPGTWYHLVVQWDGGTGTATLSVNGTSVSSAAGQAFVANVDGPLTIGARSDNAFGWAGAIDEVAVYGSVLSAATINSHIANANDANRAVPYPTLIQASNPLGYWRLNEAAHKTDLAGIYTDIPTGNSNTVGRIHLMPGDYPISATFFEIGGGSWFEIFARREIGDAVIPFVALGTTAPSFEDVSGLPLATPVPPAITNFGVAGDTITITFSMTPGLSYVIESSFDLTTWTTRDTILSGPGATTTWSKSLTALGLNTQRRVVWRARQD